LTGGNLDLFSAFPLLDPDVLANTLQADALNPSPLSAGREVLAKVDEHLKHGQSFAIETTLSGKNYLRTMLVAREMGFNAALVYVGTSSVEINIARIARRVIGGGHNVPDADVRRRYERSLSNLVIAAHRADFVIVFDNSTDRGYQKVVLIDKDECTWFDPVPSWAEPLRASFERT